MIKYKNIFMIKTSSKSFLGKNIYKIILLIISGISCLIPFILTMLGRINPCSSMIHEQIGYYYLISWIFNIDYTFIETGHASLAYLAYPASLIIKLCDASSSDYQKIFHFGLTFYLLHGLLLWLLTANLMIRENINLFSRFLLSISALWVGGLEKVSNIGLMINYHKGNEILNICFIIWFCNLLEKKKIKGNSFFIATGLLLGFGFANKISYGLIYLLFAVTCLFLWQKEKVKKPRAFIYLIMSGSVSFFFTLFVLTGFKIKYVFKTIEDSFRYYQNSFLSQKTPFLAQELQKILNPEGYYFSYQIIFILYLLQVCILLFFLIKKRKCGFIIPQALSALLIIAQLRTRFTMGTMVDSTLAIQFFFLINLLFLEKVQAVHAFFIKALALIAAVCVLTGVVNSENLKRFEILVQNSKKGMTISEIIKESPKPIVFYLSGTPQPLIFPSAEIIQYIRTLNQSAKKYQNILLPNVLFVDDKKILPFPHLGCLMEYEGNSARTEKNLKIWKEMYPEILPNASLVKSFNGAKRFQFEPLQSENKLLYYFVYPTIVFLKEFPPK